MTPSFCLILGLGAALNTDSDSEQLSRVQIRSPNCLYSNLAQKVLCASVMLGVKRHTRKPELMSRMGVNVIERLTSHRVLAKSVISRSAKDG